MVRHLHRLGPVGLRAVRLVFARWSGWVLRVQFRLEGLWPCNINRYCSRWSSPEHSLVWTAARYPAPS